MAKKIIYKNVFLCHDCKFKLGNFNEEFRYFLKMGLMMKNVNIMELREFTEKSVCLFFLGGGGGA